MFTKYTSEILQELFECLREEAAVDFSTICSAVNETKKIFVSGMGRTGYVMRGFAMRLAQAGYEAYWIGDTNTPAAGKNDLLILGSGSGETEILKVYMKKAKEYQLRSIVFTTCIKSYLYEQAEIPVLIKANAKFESDVEKKSLQPMGSLFEEALFIVLEALVLQLMDTKGISEKELKKRHANLE